MKKYFFILLLFSAACNNKQTDNVEIKVDHPAKAVKVLGVPVTALHGMKNDSLNSLAWLSLFPVCSMPADTDMRNYQPPLTGSYRIDHDDIVFTPDIPFKSGQTYFARYYRYDERITSMDLVMHKRTPGKANYTELIFKY
jgi:hypothetical protein